MADANSPGGGRQLCEPTILSGSCLTQFLRFALFRWNNPRPLPACLYELTYGSEVLAYSKDIRSGQRHIEIGNGTGPLGALEEFTVFGGAHQAGCQFVYADGSVHTIVYDVDAETFESLGSRNGEEAVNKNL